MTHPVVSPRAALRHLKDADPRMADVIARVGPCRFEARAEGTHFEYVLRAIVYQQLSGKAAATIHGRVVALFDGEVRPEALLRTPDESLRAAGLSRQKMSYLRDLAEKAAGRAVPIDRLHEMDDAGVIEALCAIRGVGLWTAQMFLMFRLGRPDVLPAEDLGIRKGVQLAYRTRGLPPPKRVLEIGRRWRPHATIASWYLWRSLDVAAAPRPGGA